MARSSGTVDILAVLFWCWLWYGLRSMGQVQWDELDEDAGLAGFVVHVKTLGMSQAFGSTHQD